MGRRLRLALHRPDGFLRNHATFQPYGSVAGERQFTAGRFWQRNLRVRAGLAPIGGQGRRAANARPQSRHMFRSRGTGQGREFFACASTEQRDPRLSGKE